MTTGTRTDAAAVIPGTERDFEGYGQDVPVIEWPNGARVAVSLCLNIEEGAEYNYLDGDGRNETVAEIAYAMPEGHRDLSQESFYEYGSRAGVWRILRLLDTFDVKVTAFAAAQALERAPEVARALVAAGHEPCSHGLRWTEPYGLSVAEQREEILRAVASLTQTCGKRPLGWYTRYAPSVHTRRLLVEEGGFTYDSNAYNDDLPYWVPVDGQRHLVIPYTHTYNDGRFTSLFARPSDFFEICRRGIEYLWEEGATHPKMLSIGLHSRLIGQAGRASALRDLLEWSHGKGHIWFARRCDIAEWWTQNYQYLTTDHQRKDRR